MTETGTANGTHRLPGGLLRSQAFADSVREARETAAAKGLLLFDPFDPRFNEDPSLSTHNCASRTRCTVAPSASGYSRVTPTVSRCFVTSGRAVTRATSTRKPSALRSSQ